MEERLRCEYFGKFDTVGSWECVAEVDQNGIFRCFFFLIHGSPTFSATSSTTVLLLCVFYQLFLSNKIFLSAFGVSASASSSQTTS